MNGQTQYASIVLCAGKGRRMQAPKTPKVCFPIAGKPAIAHLLEHLTALGFSPNILVVGYLAGAVVEEVGPRFPETLFAYQSALHGTGHAARQGAAVLRRSGFDGAVLVAAGDKVVEERALDKLVQAFDAEQADMALLVAPKEHWPNAGRIVQDARGRVVCCVERADLRHAQEQGAVFTIDGHELPAVEVEDRCSLVNQAIYLFRAQALYHALDRIGRDNVQQEEYLTDAIAVLIGEGRRVIPIPVDDPNDVLAFNSPEELLQIEEHFRSKAGLEVGPGSEPDARVFKSPETWTRCLGEPDADVRRMLQGLYGDNSALCEEKRRHLLEAVALFIERFGKDGEVAVIRARNADARTFGDLEFTSGELLRDVRLDDWTEFVNSEAVIRMVRDLQGDWGNYLKAPMLRLQQEFRDRQILGVDCVVRGDIPMAAGLSSSSALVVAMAEALVRTNGLPVSPHDMVDVCGEGEWFVGTRGGSADHAAVKLSQFGQVAHVGFFPFTIKAYVPFPAGYALILCNSRVQARKAEGARDVFNERVASYAFGVHVVRHRFPNYAPLIRHLRDVSQEGLGVRAADVYGVLMGVPEHATPEELRHELGQDTCTELFATHRPPACYSLRARLLFGIAECARSSRCLDLLRQGDIEQVGQLMNISHDGDRVVARDGAPFSVGVGDDVIRARIDDLHSEDPDRVLAAQLYMQPGTYACSIREVDEMVDVALATPGVLGAQLSGAGLGGCMMVLAHRDAAASVIERMNTSYYAPHGLEPGALTCTPIAGCGVLALDT